MKKPLEIFKEMLENLKDEIKDNKAIDYQSVLLSLYCNIGDGVKILEKLSSEENNHDADCEVILQEIDERINHLINKESLSELFIIHSCINHLSNDLRNYPYTILDNYSIFKEMKEKFPNNELANKKLSEINNPDYRLGILHAQDAWNLIIAKNFGNVIQRQLRNNEVLDSISDHKV